MVFGAGASAAFSVTAQAMIELLRIAGKMFRRTGGTPDIMVTEDVTGTDNHEMVG